jgi:hypothetical protein
MAVVAALPVTAADIKARTPGRKDARNSRNPAAFCEFREKAWLHCLDQKYFYEQPLADLLKS